MPTQHPQPIAVIGLACRYPDAHTPLQLWENVLARRRQFRRLPAKRLALDDYFDTQRHAEDKTYGRQAAVIDGFDFDWASRRIPLSTFQSTDVVHWLALDTALAAITDAGYTKERLPGDRTGVIIGNTLTGEQTRSQVLRLRWPFVRRVLQKAGQLNGLSAEGITVLSATMKKLYKSVFAPTNEDTLAGGLSNTIAGRICNYLHLYGGGYTVDGACSSSLLAVSHAAARLCLGDLDLAIVGGVDVSLDPFELVGFAKTGALTPGEMNVYDRTGSGFIPGEGCGFVVLKRLADARADGDGIYAVIHGWGISSDGGAAGITAPSAEGQARAIAAAYRGLSFGPQELNFIEGHGTATVVGDRTELEAVNMVMAQAGCQTPRSCGMTSLKSIIGHTKAASGIGGLIKVVMALNRRMIPPTAACRAPHPVFDTQARFLYPVRQGKCQPADQQMYAGVSSMGFGGINCHVALASADAPRPELAPQLTERQLMASAQQSEIFVLTTPSAREMERQIHGLAELAQGISLAELTDLAAEMGREADPNARVRCAVVAGSPGDLKARCLSLIPLLEQQRLGAGPSAEGDHAMLNVQAGSRQEPPRIGFLFPGQGSQRLNMARILVERFAWAEDLLHQAEELVAEAGADPLGEAIYPALDQAADQQQIDQWSRRLADTRVSQPAICLASVMWLEYLGRLGIRPAAVGGHSLGELTAFHAAGAFDVPSLFKFAVLRGRAMADNHPQSGAMLSLQCSRRAAEALLSSIDGYLILANINSPRQMVLSGEAAAVERAIRIAAAEGILSRRLAVSNAFHSKLAAEAAEIIAQQASLPQRLAELKCRLFTSTNGAEVSAGLELGRHFSHQILSQVNFIEMIAAMGRHCDLLVEVGPGRVLSGLVGEMTAVDKPPCLPVESVPGGDEDLNRCLAALFVRGVDIRWPVLYEGRLVRPFTPPAKKIFIENPCERPFSQPAAAAAPMAELLPMAGESALARLAGIPVTQLTDYIQSRGNFLARVIHADLGTKPTVAAPAVELPEAPQAIEAFESSGPATERDALKARLFSLVQEITGFAPESLEEEARLLDDLNLDSIKAGDLLARLAGECGFGWPSDPKLLSNASLGEITDAVLQLTGQVLAQQPAFTSDAATLIRTALLETTEAITGFPKESFDLRSRLLDDLNLDSIKIGDLISRTAQMAGLKIRLEKSDLTGATLGSIVDMLLGQEKGGAARVPTTTPEDVLEAVLTQASRITGFPRGSIDTEALVERDLHMGPDLLKTLLRRLAASLGVEADVDLEPLRNRSLKQIAEVFHRMVSRQAQVVSPATGVKAEAEELMGFTPWVRDFAVEMEPNALVETAERWGKRREDDWQVANVAILTPAESTDAAAAIEAQLLRNGAQVKTMDFEQAMEARLLKDPSITHWFALMPKTCPPENGFSTRLAERVRQLSSLAAVPASAEALRHRTSLNFIQFGGGHLGHHDQFADAQLCATAAFAASLHHERHDLKIRVIDFSPALAPELIATQVLAEISTPQGYCAAGYDFELTRRTAVVHLLEPWRYLPRNLDWTAHDVLLVTGGAKGITALCALAVARETGCRMALLGRSPHPDSNTDGSGNEEIQALLAQYAEAGLRAVYYQCDVSDPDAVRTTLHLIETELGAISGVIHGAGLNIPRPAHQVSAEAALEEISPKLAGLQHLLEMLSDAPPKLIMALSSIIGFTGMPGNAWYAFSNEAMEIMLRRFGAQRSQTQTLAVAFSIWRDQGMGARLGAVSQLRRQGIAAIPSEIGTAHFTRLFHRRPACARVVVTSRLGGLDTWPLPQPEVVPGARFLEKQHHCTAGVESIHTAHLSLARDLYLKDHLFQGSYLFPTVFGLEAMAQAVAHISGITAFDRLRIEMLRLEHPITVDAQKGADISIRAEVLERDTHTEPLCVQAFISKLGTGIQTPFFSARFVFSKEALSRPPAACLNPPAAPLGILPKLDLYRETLLFQGPLFQRIERIWTIDATEAYQGNALFEPHWAEHSACQQAAFADGASLRLYLTDPFFSDALLQATALLVPQDRSLPIAVDEIDYAGPPESQSGPLVAQVRLLSRQGDDLISEVTAVDRRGRVVQRLSGYRLRIVRSFPHYPTAKELAAPDQRDQQLLDEQLRKAAETLHVEVPAVALAYGPDNLSDLSQSDRQKAVSALVQTALDAYHRQQPDAVVGDEIVWDRQDRVPPPATVDEQRFLGVTWDPRLRIAAAGSAPWGCHLESVQPRSRKQWIDLLGSIHEGLLDTLIDHGDPLDLAGTRIYAAMQLHPGSARQAALALQADPTETGAVLFQSPAAQTRTILTLPLQLTWGPEKVFALEVIQRQPARPAAVTPHLPLRSYETLRSMRAWDVASDRPDGQQVYVQRFPVTFKPSAQLSRRLYFSNYVHWMGMGREASTWPVMPQLMELLATGRWGSVTNFSEVSLLGEAKTGDLIEMRMWASDNSGPHNSTMTLSYDFRNLSNGGTAKRLALARLQTTWVSLPEPGVARPAPYPDFFATFIADMLPRPEAPLALDALDQPLDPLKHRSQSDARFQARPSPVVEPVLAQHTFETSLGQANAVGNLYYANYYEWQGHLRDRWFYDIVPDRFQGTGERGELICLACRVNHLREAMPFDQVTTTMSLKALWPESILLHFDYHRLMPDGSLTKLAYGDHEAIWVRRDRDGTPQPAPFPEAVQNALDEAIASVR